MGILNRAELLLQAKNYSGSGDWLDESGNGHDAQFGSTSGADTNDPEVLAHDGEDYVRLPGVANNFVDTADVNLLDADTAHIQQSVGSWSVTGATIAQSSDVTPTFGAFVLKATANGTNTVLARTPGGTSGIAVPSATLMTVSYDARTPVADRLGGIRIREFDAAGVSLGDSSVAWNAIDDTGMTRISKEITTQATAAFIRIEFRLGTLATGLPDSGDVLYVDAFCLRLGTGTSFVPSLRIGGDDETEAVVALDDYTPSAAQVLWDDGATKCTLDTAGDFTFEMWGDTTAAMTPLSALTDGDRYTFKIVGVESTGVVTFTIDGVTQDTDTLTPASPTYDDFYVGADTAAANPLAGDAYTVTRRDGIDGPVVARYSAEDAVEPFATQTGSVDGRVWTYNRSGSGLYLVDQPAFGLHTDDFFEVADHADLDFGATDPLTVLAIVRVSDTTAAPSSYVSKKNGIDITVGYELHDNAANVAWLIADGAAAGGTVTVGNIVVRTRLVAAGRRDVVADDVSAFLDGVEGTPASDDTTGTLANANPLRIGASGHSTPAEFFDGEIMAVALFREALTDDEIVEAGDALLGLGGNFFILASPGQMLITG